MSRKKNEKELMEEVEEDDPSVLLEQQQQQPPQTMDNNNNKHDDDTQNGILDVLIDLSLSYLLGPSVHATRSFVVPTVVSQLKQRLLPARWKTNHIFEIPEIKPNLEEFPFVALQNVVLDVWATCTCYESQQLFLDTMGILTHLLLDTADSSTKVEGGVWMCHMVDVMASSSAKQTYHNIQTALEEIRTWLLQEPQVLFLQTMTRQFLQLLQEEHVHVRQLQKQQQQQQQRRTQYIAKTYLQQQPEQQQQNLVFEPTTTNTNVVQTPPPKSHPPEEEEDGLELPPSSVTIPKSPTITDLESLVDSLSPQNSLVNVNYLKETIHHRATIAQELQHHQQQQQKSPNTNNDLQYDPLSTPSTTNPEEEKNTPPTMVDFLKSLQNDLIQQRKSTSIRKQRRTTTTAIAFENQPPSISNSGIVTRIRHWKLKYQLLLLFVLSSMFLLGLIILGLAIYGIYAICFLRSQQGMTNEIILRLYQEHQQEREHVMVIPTTSPFIQPDDL